MRTFQENLMALLDASDKMARRTPQEAAAVRDALFRPALEAEFMQNLVDSTLAQARSEYRASQARMASHGERALPAVSMDDIAFPATGELMLAEDASLPASLLDLVGIQPAVISAPASPAEAQAAFVDGVARLQREKQQAGTE